MATCKHFAAYSFEGAEGESRYTFNAELTKQVRKPGGSLNVGSVA